MAAVCLHATVEGDQVRWLTRSGVMVFSVSAGTSITSFRSRLVIIGGLS